MANDKKGGLKSTYDLAMERMAQRGEGMTALSAEQKTRLAQLSAATRAKIAEIEILFGKTLDAARAEGDAEKIAKAEGEMRQEIRKVKDREEAERKKIRGSP